METTMEKDKRRRRRKDLRRMKERAKKIYHWNDPNEAAKLAEHLAHCSLSCCGNPRKWWGELTMQEKRVYSCNE